VAERNARVFNRQFRMVAEVASQVLHDLVTWMSARFHFLLPLGHSVSSRHSQVGVL
jgi:hypothetical protein